MIPLVLLLQVAAPVLPPLDWTFLPDLPIQPPPAGFDPSGYVQREVAAGRCKAVPEGDAQQVVSSVAVLIDESGAVQKLVPRAIDCPTVEQFTAGYVSTLARRASASPTGLRPGWYRYAVTYRWRG